MLCLSRPVADRIKCREEFRKKTDPREIRIEIEREEKGAKCVGNGRESRKRNEEISKEVKEVGLVYNTYGKSNLGMLTSLKRSTSLYFPAVVLEAVHLDSGLL
jgi:hypothetical protein